MNTPSTANSSENDPVHGLNKPKYVWFVQGLRKTIISKPQTYVWVRSGGNPEPPQTILNYPQAIPNMFRIVGAFC